MHLADLPPLPEAPGVYQWWKGSSVIYVGKAKSLKARVSSYFHGEGKALTIASEADRLEFIVTRDEVEALLLEANLIKLHRPRYNVLMKDDKHYPFLKLTNEPYPILLIVRRVDNDGARYWGPFPDGGAVRRIKRLIDRIFPIRKNSGVPLKKRRYPCLNFSMGRCLAPCIGQADPAAYREMVRQVEQVLDGKVSELLGDLELKMRQAARNQDFERAAEIRDQMEAVRSFFGTVQQAYDPELGDLDFLGLARAGRYAIVQLYQVRGGQMLGRNSRFIEDVEEASDQELLWAFLRDYYLEATPSPAGAATQRGRGYGRSITVSQQPSREKSRGADSPARRQNPAFGVSREERPHRPRDRNAPARAQGRPSWLGCPQGRTGTLRPALPHRGV